MSGVLRDHQRFFHFSLRTLLLFVVAASLALAAMRYATSAWASGIVTLTVLLLIASVALAGCSGGVRRPFWVGFAICGIGYFALVMSPYPLAPEILETLGTSRSVVFLRDKFHPAEDYPTRTV